MHTTERTREEARARPHSRSSGGVRAVAVIVAVADVTIVNRSDLDVGDDDDDGKLRNLFFLSFRFAPHNTPRVCCRRCRRPSTPLHTLLCVYAARERGATWRRAVSRSMAATSGARVREVGRDDEAIMRLKELLTARASLAAVVAVVDAYKMQERTAGDGRRR